MTRFEIQSALYDARAAYAKHKHAMEFQAKEIQVLNCWLKDLDLDLYAEMFESVPVK